MEDEVKRESDGHEYKDVGSRSRKYAKFFPDDSSGSDISESQNPSGKFKVQTYYTIVDLLVNELRKRRAAIEWL